MRAVMFGVLLAACGTGDDSSSMRDAPIAGAPCGTYGLIMMNHGHVWPTNATFTFDQQGAPQTISIQGSATHDHQVVITPELFARLRNHEDVAITSSVTEQHSHVVTVSCQ